MKKIIHLIIGFIIVFTLYGCRSEEGLTFVVLETEDLEIEFILDSKYRVTDISYLDNISRMIFCEVDYTKKEISYVISDMVKMLYKYSYLFVENSYYNINFVAKVYSTNSTLLEITYMRLVESFKNNLTSLNATSSVYKEDLYEHLFNTLVSYFNSYSYLDLDLTAEELLVKVKECFEIRNSFSYQEINRQFIILNEAIFKTGLELNINSYLEYMNNEFLVLINEYLENYCNVLETKSKIISNKLKDTDTLALEKALVNYLNKLSEISFTLIYKENQLLNEAIEINELDFEYTNQEESCIKTLNLLSSLLTKEYQESTIQSNLNLRKNLKKSD